MNEKQKDALLRLRQYFPYRIIFGCIDKNTGEFSAWAKVTKHKMNSLVRNGHKVYILTK